MSSCKRTATWDAWGGALSLLCAVHCVVLPVVLPFAAEFIHNIWIEVGMMLGAICIGGFALAHGFKRHGFRWPAILFGLGMSCILLGNWVLTAGRPLATLDADDHPAPSIVFVALGGVLIVTAHVMNYIMEGRSMRDPEVGVHRQMV